MAAPSNVAYAASLFAAKGEAQPAPGFAARPTAARGDAGPSPLSYLIQRGGAAAAPATRIRAEAVERICPPAVAAGPRRQLTLRLQREDFERFRAIAEAEDSTYQGILERAVTGFVDRVVPPRGR